MNSFVRLSLFSLTVLAGASTALADGEAASPWVGVRVMPKTGCQLKDKGEVIKDSKVNRVPYRVMETKGEWLLVGDRQPGWVKISDVVPIEKAVEYYTQEIKKDPKSTLPYIQRAISYQEMRDREHAVADYTQAIKLEPKNALALKNRAALYSQNNEVEKALADFEAALKLDPNFVAAYVDRGSLLYGKGRYEEAAADHAKAVELDPSNGNAHYCYATTLEAQKKIDEAMQEYERAIQHSPRDPLAYNNLAWILATSPQDSRRDGARAVTLAAKACELTNWKDPEYADTLAAAHAEAGNWEKAIRTAEYALSLVPADRRAAMQKHLDLFKQQQVFRSE